MNQIQPKKSRIFSLLLTAAFFASSCNSYGQTEKTRPTDQPQPQVVIKAELGQTKNVSRAGDLYFAGQFTADYVAEIKAAEFDRVITLRTDGEIDWDEQAAVEAAGIEFLKLPVRSPDSFDDKLFDDIRELLGDKTKKTLFHCGSANRVGGVWLPFRVLDEKMPLEFAVQEAEAIGLRTPFIKEKALDYIKRQQHLTASPIARSEASVNPGINTSYLDPNLSVDKMVKRFEVESREIYLARNKIVPMAGILPGLTVADIGSGTGLFTVRFADMVGKGGWVYAVDIAPRLVQHVSHEAQRRKLKNVTAILCHEDNVNLPEASIDVAFICDTYHHFEYPKSTMASIYKALKPGGTLLLIDFERIEGVTRPWIMDHVRAGKDIFRAEIQDAGFTMVQEIKIAELQENYFLKFKKPN